MKKFSSIYKVSAILLCSLSSAFMFSGCATIFRGTKETLVIDSQPTNAYVRLSNGLSGVTPTSFNIARDSFLTGIVEKEGYKPCSFQINHRTTRAAGDEGNIVIGFSGATQELTPNPLLVNLERLSSKAESSWHE